MISYPRWLEDTAHAPRLRLIGVGNAGVHIADRIARLSSCAIETVALNSDQHSLNNSSAATRVALGPMTTHGLGAGGDAETGLEAAKESLKDILTAIDGADVLLICAGLGGGTGGPTTALIAQLAKERGALPLAIVTSPFRFEGRRRATQATEALDELKKHADAIVHFENDRMADFAEAGQEAAKTFAACDELLAGAIKTLACVTKGSGPLPVSLPDLISILRHSGDGCVFGLGSADGVGRAELALEEALRSPLLDNGLLLKDGVEVLVHISGPANIAFLEVAKIMQGVSKHIAEKTNLHLTLSAGEETNPLTVALIGRTGAVEARPLPPREQPAIQQPAIQIAAPEDDPARPTPKTVAPKIRQENLQLDPIAKGRFEKSEPTMFEGEDLDIPTFIRRKLLR